MVRVAVGSENPVKRAATEAVLGDVAGDVEAVDVDPGVPAQPWGESETVAGATNRAQRALAAGDFDLGVGLEGGVARVDSLDGLFVTMWAAVTDGAATEHGAGPRLRLPEAVATRMADGGELGPVLEAVLDVSDDGTRMGAAGVLTGNAITRQSALEHALAGALGPFVTGHY